MFNASHNSRYIEAAISLCQHIADIMQRIPLDVADSLPQVSLFERNRDEVYVNLLNDILYMGKLYNCELTPDPNDMSTILEMIYSTPQPVFKNEIVSSHIKSPRITHNDANRYRLKIVSPGSVIPPGIVDIHTFNDTNRSLLGD